MKYSELIWCNNLISNHFHHQIFPEIVSLYPRTKQLILIYFSYCSKLHSECFPYHKSNNDTFIFLLRKRKRKIEIEGEGENVREKNEKLRAVEK